MSDRSAREPAHEVKEAEALEPAEVEVADVPEMAPVELVAAAEVATPTEATATTGRGFEDEQVVAERRKLSERIESSQSLPPGLRSRLVEIAQAGGNVADAVLAFEESLPSVLRGGAVPVSYEHPAGEVFFRGDAEAISDEQAESIARGQLARSGMLRGQRVKVAD